MMYFKCCALALLCAASIVRAQNSNSNPHSDNGKTITFSVVDGKGKLVGDVIGIGGQGNADGLLYVLVAIKTNGALIQMGVKPSGFVDPAGGTSAGVENYESTNCTGTPYSGSLNIAGITDSLFTPADLVGTKVFVIDQSMQSKAIRVQSQLTVEGCQPHSNSLGGPPVKMLVDLSTLYTPPFTIR
jgi:hypothetical protein